MGGKYFGIEINQNRVISLSALMEQFGIDHQIWCSDSLKITDGFIRDNIGRIDFAYLDGNHTLEAIWHEITTIWPYVRDDGKGYVFIHDIYTASKEGWAKVKAAFPETMEIKAQSGMGVVRKI